MKAFKYKMIFSTVLLVTSSLLGQSATAKSNPPMYYQGLNVYNCERTVKDLFPYFDEQNKTSEQNDDRYNNERVQIEAACRNNSSPYFVMCAMDLIDATYVGERNPNGGQLKWGNYNVEGQTLRKVKTLEEVCGSARNMTYQKTVGCVADLFLRGGVRMTSDDPSVMTGVRLCASNNTRLYKCITDRYQSRQYSANQALTTCMNEYGSGKAQTAVTNSRSNSTLTDADYERTLREARASYNRAHGLTSPSEQQTRQAEPVQQKQQQLTQQQQQSKNSAPKRTEPPASSKSSSGDVIEDLPSL